MQNNDELESVWADGIPKMIKDEDLLDAETILRMCIKSFLEKEVSSGNCELLDFTPKINAFPNVVVQKNDQIYGIAVIPCIYPHYLPKNNDFRFQFVKHCDSQNCLPVICPVAIHSLDEARKKASILLEGDLFNCYPLGMKILNLDPEQDLSFDQLNFTF